MGGTADGTNHPGPFIIFVSFGSQACFPNGQSTEHFAADWKDKGMLGKQKAGIHQSLAVSAAKMGKEKGQRAGGSRNVKIMALGKGRPDGWNGQAMQKKGQRQRLCSDGTGSRRMNLCPIVAARIYWIIGNFRMDWQQQILRNILLKQNYPNKLPLGTQFGSWCLFIKNTVSEWLAWF